MTSITLKFILRELIKLGQYKMPSMKRRYYQRWDGESKNKTKNCDSCIFKVYFYDKEICAWGVAFKYIGGEPTRKCEYIGKEPPKNNSLEYVTFAKKNNLLGKSKNYKNNARQLSFAFYNQ
jgi:hypothetical protein